METLGRLSRGRPVLNVTEVADADGIEAVIDLARRAGHRVIFEAAGDREVRTAARLADGLVSLDDSAELLRSSLAPVPRLREELGIRERFDVWARIGMPTDRESWRRIRQEFEDAGATGVIVPADPRLLDLLRNADEDDDRSDLVLAQG
jgi:hypothetical protein